MKSRLWIFVALSVPCVFFTMVGISLCAEYHVALNGSDSGGNGSLSYPWRSPVYGASRLSSGDTLYIHAGTYQVTTTNSPIKNAAICPAADNTTIKSYPGDTVILVGNGGIAPTNGVIGTHDGRNIRNNVTIDGLIIQGVVVVMGNGHIVQNCDISIGGDSWSGIGQGEVIWIENAANCIIRNNKIHNNTVQSGHRLNSPLIMEYGSSGITIENNEIYNSVGNGVMLKDHPQNMTVRYNYIHDTYYSGIWTANQVSADNVEIYQNVFNNCNNGTLDPNYAEHGGVSIVIHATNVKIYNNTFFNSGNADIVHWVSDTSATFHVWNNISANPKLNHISFPYSASVLQGSLLYCDYNNYYNDVQWRYRSNVYSTLANWRTACQSMVAACDSHSITDNPNFLNSSGTWSRPEDFKRSSYPANGRGGNYAAVMGAYITGNEIIGCGSGVNPAPPSPPPPVSAPSAPSGLRIIQ